MNGQAGDDSAQAVEAFVAELKHWREVAGVSQKALARLVQYDPSYISKVENGSLVPSREFAENADKHLRAGRAILRRWREIHGKDSASGHRRTQAPEESGASTVAGLVVEHESAELAYREGIYRTTIRRRLHNVGTEPVTRYLIRIAVDKYPGDPERSNQLYRKHPLTWEEVGLAAFCGDEPMVWRAKHDRDAFKEVWLLFENRDGRFPLYPGEKAWIEYTYTVNADKWGLWWQRAIRLPTQRISICLDLPAETQPIAWGMETSMTAEASPFRSPIIREELDDRVLFSWSTDDPPMHARYRIEWKFKARGKDAAEMTTMSPSARMQSLGISQEGDPVLREVARPFDLPRDAEDARRVIAQLLSMMERVSRVHTFAKGMGLAASQVGISRAAALVRTQDGESITLLNPRIIDESTETDEQYEGCLSFFDVRGMVPRPLAIEVEHKDIDGGTQITVFEQGLARLVAHEIDHLNGVFYRDRMRTGVDTIPISQYKGTGAQWAYRPNA